MGANCCNTPSQLLFLDQIASAASSISPISSPSSSAPPTTPSRTAPTARPASANNKTRVAIGAGIGSFVAVAGGIGAYFLCRRRRKKQQKTKKAPAPVPMNIILTAPTHYAPSTVSTSESRDLSNLPNLSSPRPYADSSVSTYAPSLTFDEIGVPPFPEALHDDEVDIASIPASAHDDDTEALITQELDLESFPERPPLPPLPSRSP
ncbi:MAG: hypothetical protein M1814_006829 [Vezdaea aestivalis]|nr:MAG: hypothetical protein M1814_006829 [Vezdaea aestivalis]